MTLSIVGFPVAVPAPQKDNGNLDSLITSVFGAGTQTVAPAADQNSNGDLSSLISEVFGSQSTSTTVAPVLGTANKPKPDDCDCVPYYQCRDGTILEDGTALIDIRSVFDDDTNALRVSR